MNNISTIEVNNILNDFKLPGNLKNNSSNIKKIFGSLIKTQPIILEEYNKLLENISLKNIKTDILQVCKNSEGNRNILESYGYKQTSEKKYQNESFNYSELINYEGKFEVYKNSIDFFDGFNNTKLHFGFEDNRIIFVNKNARSVVYEIIYTNIELIDFIIKDKYVFLYYKKDGIYYLIKSHLTMNFGNIDGYTSDYEIEYLWKVTIGSDDNLKDNKILFIENDSISFINNSIKTQYKLLRKHFFIIDDKIYYNILDNVITKDNYDKIQIEHLYMYDLLNLLGLNNFTNNGFKISTKEIDKFKNLLKFKFDNTRNGGINFFDFWESDKSYKVDIVENKFKIYGNFYEEKLGDFKIEINSNDTFPLTEEIYMNVCLYKSTENGFVLIKKIDNYKTYKRKLFFCNLCFDFLDVEYENFNYSFEVSNEQYPFMFDENIEYIENDIEDNSVGFISNIHNNAIINTSSNKKQIIDIKIEDNKLKIKDVIKDKDSTVFGNDIEIDLVVDGEPSSFWKSINTNNHKLISEKNYVTKNSSVTLIETPLTFTDYSFTFKLGG